MDTKKYGIKAYGRWHRFTTRGEYERYLNDWIAGTVGAEQSRAVDALVALDGGQAEWDSDAN